MIKKLFVVFSVAFLIFGCEKKPQEIATTDKSILLSTFSGNQLDVDIKNKKFSFNGFDGKPLLVVFFATWCPPCKAEMPELVLLQKEFSSKANILAVVLEQDKDKTEIANFIKQYNINFQVAVSNENFNLAKAFGGVKGIPAAFLLDANGSVVRAYSGAVPREILQQDISKTLK